MHTRTPGRRLLIGALALWLMTAGLVLASRRYLVNVLLGPFPLGRQELLSLADVDRRAEYYVSIEGDRLELLFPRAYTAGSKPYAMYAILNVGPRQLLLRVPGEQQGVRWTGTLEGLSAFERDHIMAGRPASLPFRLEATRYFRTVGWLLGVGPIGILVAAALLLTVSGVRRRHASAVQDQVLPVTGFTRAITVTRLAGEQVLGRGADPADRAAGRGAGLAEPAASAQGKPGDEQGQGGHDEPAADVHGRLLVRLPDHPILGQPPHERGQRGNATTGIERP